MDGFYFEIHLFVVAVRGGGVGMAIAHVDRVLISAGCKMKSPSSAHFYLSYM